MFGCTWTKSMHNRMLGRFGQNWFLAVNVQSNKVAAIAWRFIGLVIFYSFIVRLSFYLCVGVKHSFPCRHFWAVMLELKRLQMASDIFGNNENTWWSHSIQFSNILLKKYPTTKFYTNHSNPPIIQPLFVDMGCLLCTQMYPTQMR